MILTFLVCRANAPHPLEALPDFDIRESLGPIVPRRKGLAAGTRMKIADLLDVAALRDLARTRPGRPRG